MGVLFAGPKLLWNLDLARGVFCAMYTVLCFPMVCWLSGGGWSGLAGCAYAPIVLKFALTPRNCKPRKDAPDVAVMAIFTVGLTFFAVSFRSKFGPWTKSQAGLVSCLEPWKNIHGQYRLGGSFTRYRHCSAVM